MMSLNCDHFGQANAEPYAEIVAAGDSGYCWNNSTAEDIWGDSRSSSASPVSASSSSEAERVKTGLLLHHHHREEADGLTNNNGGRAVSSVGGRFSWKDDTTAAPTEKAALKERNWRRNARPGVYKHVPHKDKPPQVVARRNARERRRVQAVNSAFLRLRRAVPIENTRGKRISKVKTLQNAIDYINGLKKLLEEDGQYHPLNIYSNYRYANNSYTFLEDLEDFEDEI